MSLFCSPFEVECGNGAAVHVVGLQSRPDLNGRAGACFGESSSAGRYEIEIDGEAKPKALKRANFTLDALQPSLEFLFDDARNARDAMAEVAVAVRMVDARLAINARESADIAADLKEAIRSIDVAAPAQLALNPGAVDLIARYVCLVLVRIVRSIDAKSEEEMVRANEFVTSQKIERLGAPVLNAEERNALLALRTTPPEADGVIRSFATVLRAVQRAHLFGKGGGRNATNQAFHYGLQPEAGTWEEWRAAERAEYRTGRFMPPPSCSAPRFTLPPATAAALLGAVCDVLSEGERAEYATVEGEALEAVALVAEQAATRLVALSMHAAGSAVPATIVTAAAVSATMRGTSVLWCADEVNCNREFMQSMLGDVDFPLVLGLCRGADPTIGRPKGVDDDVYAKSADDARFDALVGEAALAACVATAATHASTNSGYNVFVHDRVDSGLVCGVDGAATKIVRAAVPFPRPLGDVPRRLARLRAGGELRMQLGDIVGAISHFRCATALSAHDWRAWEGLARAKTSLSAENVMGNVWVRENALGAVKDCEIMLVLAPASPLAWFRYGATLACAGRDARAFDELDKLIKAFVRALSFSLPGPAAAKERVAMQRKGIAARCALTLSSSRAAREAALARAQAMRARETAARAAEGALAAAPMRGGTGEKRDRTLRAAALAARAAADADAVTAADMPPPLTARSTLAEVHAAACDALSRAIYELPPHLEYDVEGDITVDRAAASGKAATLSPKVGRMTRRLDPGDELDLPISRVSEWFAGDRIAHGDERGAPGLPHGVAFEHAMMRVAQLDADRHTPRLWLARPAEAADARLGARRSGHIHVSSLRMVLLQAQHNWFGGMALARANAAFSHNAELLAELRAAMGTRSVNEGRALIAEWFPETSDVGGKIDDALFHITEALNIDRTVCALSAAQQRGGAATFVKLPPLLPGSEYSTPLHDYGGSSGHAALEWIAAADRTAWQNASADTAFDAARGVNVREPDFITGGKKFGPPICPPASNWVVSMRVDPTGRRPPLLNFEFANNKGSEQGGMVGSAPARVAAQEVLDRYYKGGARWTRGEGGLRALISYAFRASILHGYALGCINQVDVSTRIVNWGCDFISILDAKLCPELAETRQLRGPGQHTAPGVRGAVFEPSLMRAMYNFRSDLESRLSDPKTFDPLMKTVVLRLRELKLLERMARDIVERRARASPADFATNRARLHRLDWDRNGAGLQHALYFCKPLAALASALASHAHTYGSQMFCERYSGYRNMFCALATPKTRAWYAAGETREPGGVGLSAVIDWALGTATPVPSTMAMQFALGDFPLTLSLGKMLPNGKTEASRMGAYAISAMWCVSVASTLCAALCATLCAARCAARCAALCYERTGIARVLPALHEASSRRDCAAVGVQRAHARRLLPPLALHSLRCSLPFYNATNAARTRSAPRTLGTASQLKSSLTMHQPKRRTGGRRRAL